MKRLKAKFSAATILATILLLTSTTFPDRAFAARGVLEEGEDYIHFDLILTVNITKTAFNITRNQYEHEWQMWVGKWEEWENLWEGRLRERLRDQIRKWQSWGLSWRKQWTNEWRERWNTEWEPEWQEKWEDWEDWMGNWTMRWRTLRYEEMEKIPEFLKYSFRERMTQTFRNLWERHMHAPLLASCWDTPTRRLGLKEALGRSLNRTLQLVYNTSDVYIKDFHLALDWLTHTTIVDDTFMTTGIFNLTQSFDLYGVIIQNSTGTFIRSQFRRFNVTDKVYGRMFGYPDLMFTPGKAMFMDLSVFGVPLDEWERTFDPSTNTTTFALTRDINVTTPYGNVIVDPELSLIVPGYASGVGEVIAITSLLPTDLIPIKIIAPVAVVATITAIAYYLVKRKTMMPQGPLTSL